MQDSFGGAEQQGDAAPSKARVLADTVNRLLQNLILRCAKEDGVRDYFHVAIIGYGERVEALVRSDTAADVDPAMVPVSALADRPLRLEPRTKTMPDGRGGTVERVVQTPVWFDPYAKNGTP
ncbi:MAG: VWA domain-containing protein, partial [Myxococcota bacterium]